MEKPSDRDREQEDLRLFKKYNIRFRGPACEWPAHHIRVFQHISVLGTQRFSTYYSQDSMESLEPGERFWKSSIKGRTQQLVKVTERNVGNSQSETKWRLDLEKIVYSRFECEIEWQGKYFGFRHPMLTANLAPRPLAKVDGRDLKSR
jgi:hypothetical protein